MAFFRITFCFRIILLLNEIVTAKNSIETYCWELLQCVSCIEVGSIDNKAMIDKLDILIILHV